MTVETLKPPPRDTEAKPNADPAEVVRVETLKTDAIRILQDYIRWLENGDITAFVIMATEAKAENLGGVRHSQSSMLHDERVRLIGTMEIRKSILINDMEVIGLGPDDEAV